MDEDHPINITRNPAQTVSSVVKLFGFRVRGNTVYIFFGGLTCGVLSAIMAYQIHIAIAAVMMPIPPLLSVVFIRKFVAGKPRGFFLFWLEMKLTGDRLSSPKRRTKYYAAS